MSAVIGRSWAPRWCGAGTTRRTAGGGDGVPARGAAAGRGGHPCATGEGKRSKAAQAGAVRSGDRKGWPDIEVVWRGRAYFIET